MRLDKLGLCDDSDQRVVIGAGTVIHGSLRIERKVELVIDPSARIGRIENRSNTLVPSMNLPAERVGGL